MNTTDYTAAAKNPAAHVLISRYWPATGGDRPTPDEVSYSCTCGFDLDSFELGGSAYGHPAEEHEVHVREVMGWDDEEDDA